MVTDKETLENWDLKMASIDDNNVILSSIQEDNDDEKYNVYLNNKIFSNGELNCMKHNTDKPIGQLIQENKKYRYIFFSGQMIYKNIEVKIF